MDFPDSSVGKEFACNARDLASIPGLRRPPGEGKGYPLQYSGLENSIDCIVHGAGSQTHLIDNPLLSGFTQRVYPDNPLFSRLIMVANQR